jgi:RNA polymerase sigma factor (sigma-70 family)
MTDEEKYDGLMKRHLRLINRRCYIISLYSNVSYEDAVQDVLLEIALRLDMLDENMPPDTERLWIINIVRRTLRSNKARKEILTYVADDWENIVVADTQKDYAEIFDEIAPYLEPDDRKMVQYLLEGYKIREIAEKMDIDRNTLSQRKYRLKNKIKNIYAKLYETK